MRGAAPVTATLFFAKEYSSRRYCLSESSQLIFDRICRRKSLKNVFCFGLIILLVSCSSVNERENSEKISNSVYSSSDEKETVYHLRPGTVDGCYLESGFMLIDTGVFSVRSDLLESLRDAGVLPRISS